MAASLSGWADNRHAAVAERESATKAVGWEVHEQESGEHAAALMGMTPSRGRPRVSNDNPYSESLFRTLKYCPQWPAQGFADLDAARVWVHKFIEWYNNEHRHSRIRFVTPAQRHLFDDSEILARRDAVYQAARAARPERWSGETRNWLPIGEVILNPERPVMECQKAA